MKKIGLILFFLFVFLFFNPNLKNTGKSNASREKQLPAKETQTKAKREPSHVPLPSLPSPPSLPFVNPEDEVIAPSYERPISQTKCYPNALYLEESRYIQCTGDDIQAGTKLYINGILCPNQTLSTEKTKLPAGPVDGELTKVIEYLTSDLRCTPKFKTIGSYALSIRQNNSLNREYLQDLNVYNKFQAFDDFAEVAPHSEVSLDVKQNDEGAHNEVIAISKSPEHGTAEFDANSLRYKNTNPSALYDELTYTAKDLYGNYSSAKVKFDIVRNGILEIFPKSPELSPNFRETFILLSNKSNYPINNLKWTIENAYIQISEEAKPNTNWEACSGHFIRPNESCWLKTRHQSEKPDLSTTTVSFNYENAKKPLYLIIFSFN